MEAPWFSKKRHGRRGASDRGFALVVVIIVVLLASFLASQLILQVRTELSISHNIKRRVAGHFLAQAGLNLGLFRILDRPMDIPAIGAEEDWQDFIHGYEYQVFLPLGKVTYYVTSEGGKIDLNRSPQALLELFLQYQLGEGQEEAIAIVVDSLLDWRDNDDLYRENGAESEYYGSLDDPYIPRNGKIEDPADFFLIRGAGSMVGKFSAHEVFTVNSMDGRINFNSLTPAMLDFLTGGDKESVDAYYSAQEEFRGQLTPAMASEILGDNFTKFQPYLTFGTPNNPYYYVVGTGYAGVEQDQMQSEEAVEAGTALPKQPGTIDSMVIKKEGGAFMCLAWQERYI
ncbi:MAG: general secretion pathway protein GspK [Proteobacteria bacterium]|nr:general secretion pathway protein GspK [Desulfobulbaceae bacterium]MBU4153931.1 general secretion pathway protein GspK [Pseudomonadota bacterium]MDP2105412.1 type II secretion system protein GspK [Desulfobulbaceae bacterium]